MIDCFKMLSGIDRLFDHCGRILFVVAVILGWGMLSSAAHGEDENRSPSVGAPGFVQEIFLPGSELMGKPIESEDTMVVRVVKALPTGDGFRYEIRFQGLEAGKYNLTQWLIRKDGTSTDDLPTIDVEIKSLLPPGQITPNELEMGWIPRLGGYRNLVIGAGVIWLAGLLMLIFLGRKNKVVKQEETASFSLADFLQERLEAASSNQIDVKQYAELERILFGIWRRKLGLMSVPADQALREIRENEEAGPLMLQLERWMHSPHRDPDIDLPTLLTPYRSMPVDQLTMEQDASGGKQ